MKPKCRNPAHRGSRVVRAGWYGEAPHRRQRWLCRPKQGEAHRFTELLPREEAPGSHCSECSTALDPWEGQAGARRWQSSARVVALALARVARGASYREAAREARSEARRSTGRVFYRRRRRYATDADGQLVANWVDTLTPALTQGRLPTSWPERIAVDSKQFVNVSGKSSFYVFVAYGYEQGERSGELWFAHPYSRKNARAWVDFFDQLDGTPKLVVSDMDSAIALGVGRAFPKPGDPAPDHRWSDFHVKRALRNALSPLQAQPHHPIWDLVDRAPNSAADWQAFERAVRKATTPRFPLAGANRLLQSARGQELARQAGSRSRRGPHSTGAVEEFLEWLESRVLYATRASRMGNRYRMIKLLELITLAQREPVRLNTWAKRIRIWLEQRQGLAPEQRPHDDRRGRPSLYA